MFYTTVHNAVKQSFIKHLKLELANLCTENNKKENIFTNFVITMRMKTFDITLFEILMESHVLNFKSRVKYPIFPESHVLTSVVLIKLIVHYMKITF